MKTTVKRPVGRGLGTGAALSPESGEDESAARTEREVGEGRVETPATPPAVESPEVGLFSSRLPFKR